MKVAILVLVLTAVALAAPADDNTSNREGQFEGDLKFDLFGDSSIKGKFEALVKPITDFLASFGLNGEAKTESDGKGGGHLTGNFKFSGKRASKANGAASTSNSEASSSQGSLKVPSEILSLLSNQSSQLKAAKNVRA